MEITPLHPWNLDQGEAVCWQEKLRQEIILSWEDRPIDTVAGVDVAYHNDQGTAAIAILDFATQRLNGSVIASVPASFPYVPGLLAFREGPAVLAAWEQLAQAPDLVLFDGHGTAHPRGFGLACHLGLWLGMPTIGVAKSWLYGQHTPVGVRVGDLAELYDEQSPERIIGVVLRTSSGNRPVYVSPGHRIDLAHAISLILACCRGNRLPEPLRLAHQIARRGSKSSG